MTTMNAIIRPSVSKWLTFDQIDFPENARPTNATDVTALAASIRAIGLQVPLTVIERGCRYLLIAGRHRLEALRVIGEARVPVRVVDFDDVEARLWTISENLHRTELTTLQRAEQVAEFAKLTKERMEAQKQAVDRRPARPDPVEQYSKMGGKMPQPEQGGVSAQVAQKMRRGRPEGGDSLAARELGITREEVRRAETIAALPNEVKARAVDLGFDDNQSALLEAAKAPTPEAQVEALERRTERAPGRLAQTSARPLKNLEYLAAGELAKWIKQTTPNDRTRVIRMLQECAAILEDELEAAKAA
jgi:ParB family transcriptional regulator, chromosome partitioning protein